MILSQGSRDKKGRGYPPKRVVRGIRAVLVLPCPPRSVTGSFVGASVPAQVKDRYEFSQYVLDPNRFRLLKIVRMLSLVYLFIKIAVLPAGF